MKHISMNNRILVLASAGFLLFVGMCFSVGESYARYDNEVKESVLFKGTEQEIPLDFLENCIQQESSKRPIEAVDLENTTEAADIESAGEGSTEESNVVSETVKIETADTETFQLITQKYAEEFLLLEIQFPENCNQVVLSANGINSFGKGTCYTIDGIQGFALKEAGYIELEKKEDEKENNPILMLLQTPSEEQEENWESVRATFFADDMIESYREITVGSKGKSALNLALQEEQEIITEEKGTLNWQTPVLSEGFSLETELSYLSEEGYGAIPIKNSITMEQDTIENEKMNIKVTAGAQDKRASAGTYRMILTVEYTAENTKIPLYKMAVPFFISYSQ